MKKYLPLYYRWCKVKEGTHEHYLCNAFGHEDEYLKLVTPSKGEVYKLWEEGHATFAWATGSFDEIHSDYKSRHHFTPLRRNILLLMAAMNNELT